MHDITVLPDLQSFVAPNAGTIAQTRFETGAYDFCIWSGDTRVGLIALSIPEQKGSIYRRKMGPLRLSYSVPWGVCSPYS